MKRIFHPATVRVGFAVALMCASGVWAAGYSADQDLGSLGQENIYERVITISPNAKWVNVNRDETIKFIDAASGKSFVWNFKTPAMRIDLSKVAPAGILAGRTIVAYVGVSSRELNQDNSNNTRNR